MNKDKLIVEFISALSNFSDTELVELAHLLQTTPGRKAIIGLLRNTVEIRKTKSKKRSILSKNIGNDNSFSIDTEDYEQETDGIDSVKKMFFDYLSDRSIYPGTKDVIETLNSSFNCYLEYETFRKRGRKAALTSCWTRLLNMSIEERSNLLKAFFDTHPTNGNKPNAYQELFKILTKDE